MDLKREMLIRKVRDEAVLMRKFLHEDALMAAVDKIEDVLKFSYDEMERKKVLKMIVAEIASKPSSRAIPLWLSAHDKVRPRIIAIAHLLEDGKNPTQIARMGHSLREANRLWNVRARWTKNGVIANDVVMAYYDDLMKTKLKHGKTRRTQ